MTRSARTAFLLLVLPCLLFATISPLAAKGGKKGIDLDGGLTLDVFDLVEFNLTLLQVSHGSNSDLPLDRPDVRIYEPESVVPKDFNVGDKSPFQFEVDVSFGTIGGVTNDPGRLTIDFLYDDEVFDTQIIVPDSGEGVHRYLVEAQLVGKRPGSANLSARVEVTGRRKSFFRDPEVTIERFSRKSILEVRAPYEIYTKGPHPPTVTHGQEVTSDIFIKVMTQARGQVKVLDASQENFSKIKEISGVSNAGASRDDFLLSVSESHDTECAYEPPHNQQNQLVLSPGVFEISVNLPGETLYKEIIEPGPIYATEFPKSSKTCLDGYRYMESKCDCAAGAPEIISVSAFIERGKTATVQGRGFEDVASTNILLRGRVVPASSTTPTSIEFIVPDEFALGKTSLQVQTTAGSSRTVTLTIIDLLFETEGTLRVGAQSTAKLIVTGTTEPVTVEVLNPSSDIARIVEGESMVLTTKGGKRNVAKFKIRRMKPGPISLRPKILP